MTLLPLETLPKFIVSRISLVVPFRPLPVGVPAHG